MTMGWHMIMEFEPSLVGCLYLDPKPQLRDDPPQQTMRDQHSDRGPRIQRWSTIGNSSGRDIDKFAEFGFTASPGDPVCARR